MHITQTDIFLFNEGSHFKLYDKLGAHVGEERGKQGVHFSVWAPNAKTVSVTGDFNQWNKDANPMDPQGQSGLWHCFIPDLKPGALYKYFIRSLHNEYVCEKADPFAFRAEKPPKSASVVWDLKYAWGDAQWMKTRREKNSLAAPMSIYELHIGSWRRVPEEGNRFLTYREIAPLLTSYMKEMNFTHVEFMPVMEHPFYGSWGYQVTGFFAPTSRYGKPQDLMYLIDYLHQNGLGVILDWVPSHFPTDGHGLGFFDGTCLYEHADPRKGLHPEWQSAVFNYGRNEVRSFLISSGLFWLDKYHVDGLRVDGVASILYLDYSRKEGEWIPNIYGGRENLEAISFLRRFNEQVYERFPDTQTIAEDSTSWAQVSRPTSNGGLGFGFKWDMGWMHDTLEYFGKDPIHRRHHQNNLTFRYLYAFNENFVLPLSHDEVVHEKKSILDKMPGDAWQKFANLRLLLGWMTASPGKKHVFMGTEFGQWNEWNHDASLDWHLTKQTSHNGIQHLVRDLNKLYRDEPSLHRLDCEGGGFEWVDGNDSENSVACFMRHGGSQPILIVANFTPVVRTHYRVGVSQRGKWKEVLNSDAKEYGGSGVGNLGSVSSDKIPFHNRPYSLNLTLPPLGLIFLKGS